ncbi:MAG: NAAT family transporter [Ignavibacteriae bacterium]|jgi:multiple antibiotic resistance protein|nr:NAAT family transporter [Ignavibacteriota bacterium]
MDIITAIGYSFAALFPLINPLGAIPVFCTLTASDTNECRKRIALRTSINVFFILIIFFLIGNLLLNFFGLSIGVLKIAGGLIVAHTAWEMVNSKNKLSSEEDTEVRTKQDISFTPMALPMMSGPGAIGVVIGFSSHDMILSYDAGICVGIFLIAISCYISLLLSIPLFKILGQTGIGVLNRIMGFFILAIAVLLITDGLFSLLHGKVGNF